MLYRPIREYLDQAMEEVKEFNTLEELKELVGTKGSIEFRDQGFDKRIGWKSYLLSVNGNACGYANSVL